MDPRKKKIIMVTFSAIAVLLVLAAIFAVPAGIRIVRAAYTIPRGSRAIPETMDEAIGPGGIPTKFPTKDGEIVPGWYQPGTKPAAIIFLHGLGGTRAQLAPIARHIHKDGYGILLIDQSGHGEHTRDITTFGRAESWDALAAIEWLRNRPEIDPERIGIYGASMGAATAIYAASEDSRLACVVADSSYATFESQAYHDLTTNRAMKLAGQTNRTASISVPGPFQPSFVWIFKNLSGSVIGEWAEWPDPVDVIGKIKCPLFLIHGECDERIDASNLDELTSAAREGGVDVITWKVKDEGHCLYHSSEEFLNRVTDFFRKNL